MTERETLLQHLEGHIIWHVFPLGSGHPFTTVCRAESTPLSLYNFWENVPKGGIQKNILGFLFVSLGQLLFF